jgi:hypothetical protein
MPHRVENPAHVVFTQIHQRFGGDAVHQTTLEDKRQVKTNEVVAHELVAIRIEAFHVLQKCQQRFLFVLLVAIFVYPKHMLTFALIDPGEVETRDGAFMNCN